MSDNVVALLDPDLQRFMYKKNWQTLLPIQQDSIKPILDRKTDVIISASTASGKTEAAFLPALTAINKTHDLSGVRILYVSPLKALINDQFRRLEEMTEFLNIKVTDYYNKNNYFRLFLRRIVFLLEYFLIPFVCYYIIINILYFERTSQTNRNCIIYLYW